MLNDRPRNAAFEEALRRALDRARRGALDEEALRMGSALAGRDGRGGGALPTRRLRVLDIGAGSGLLSLLAVRHGAARADAFEADARIAGFARENVRRGGSAGQIAVHALRSDAGARARAAFLGPVGDAGEQPQTMHGPTPEVVHSALAGGTVGVESAAAADVLVRRR